MVPKCFLLSIISQTKIVATIASYYSNTFKFTDLFRAIISFTNVCKGKWDACVVIGLKTAELKAVRKDL